MANLTKDSVDSEILWNSLADVLRANLGLHYPRERLIDLKRGITAAASAFGLNTAEDCARWLLASPMSPEQIQIVASCLTVGETYFFRDPRSFEILKEGVLLPIVNARQGMNKKLRIWSAACCTGEEPYSIAMMLTKVIPIIQEWMITLLATDIDHKFLQKAKEGVYSHWSFRGIPEGIMESFFSEIKPGRFAISPQIKNMVNFETLNLVKNDYPSILNGKHAMDIIFCRNVLMYFEPEQACKIIQKLSQTLIEGGWLFLSPCDVPPNLVLPHLRPLKFGDYTVYRKDSTNCARPAQDAGFKHAEIKLSPVPKPLHPASNQQLKKQDRVKVHAKPAAESTHTTLQEATLLFHQGAYDEALKTVKCGLDKNPSSAELMFFSGKIYANLGQLLEARTWCEQALELDPMNSACCYLYATILQEQGLDLNAAAMLRRVLYLDQNNPIVHFSLGNFYRRQNNPKQATKYYQNALSLLNGYKLDEDVPGSDGMNVGRLIDLIQATIDVGVGK